MTKNTTLKKMIQTSLIIAMALALRQFFSYMVPFGGGAGMRISPSIFISRLPAVLFGPLYGGITSGVIDVLGLIIKPEGSWIPLLTVSAIFGGVMAGFMWRLVKNIDAKAMRRIIFAILLLVGALGVFCHIFVSFFAYTKIGAFLSSLGKVGFWTIGCEIAAVSGILILILDRFLSKKHQSVYNDNFIKLFAAMFVANMVTTTINTFILMVFIPAVAKSGFWIFYVPRFIEELISTIVQCFVMAYLIKLYNNTVKNG